MIFEFKDIILNSLLPHLSSMHSTMHSGYSYYRGGGGIPIGAYLPPNMDIKIFFIKIIKFDFSLLQIMYILTQAWEIIVKHCGSFGTCAQSPKSSFISTVNWTKKVILRPRSPKIFLYENHQIQLFLTSNYPYFDPGFRNNCQTLWFSRYMPKRFKKQLEKAI